MSHLFVCSIVNINGILLLKVDSTQKFGCPKISVHDVLILKELCNFYFCRAVEFHVGECKNKLDFRHINLTTFNLNLLEFRNN